MFGDLVVLRPLTAEIGVPQIVGEDEHDVRARGLGSRAAAARQRRARAVEAAAAHLWLSQARLNGGANHGQSNVVPSGAARGQCLTV
jgi:hypothetical protein